MSVETTAQHEALIQSLMDPARWPDGGKDRQRIDTHISTVLLAGEVAYKLKKPLDLGFLDFATLESRRRACNEELRLNSRLAPQIYQAVCAVTGSIDRPQIDGAGPVIDWAVRMRRFDPEAILSRLTARLNPLLIDSLATQVARFHTLAAVCDPQLPFGRPKAVYEPMRQNLEQIKAGAPDFAADVEHLAAWTASRFNQLTGLLGERRASGHIRECHGDLHLGNVALIDETPVIFDSIEFNPGLRWIDTVNDIAFMSMDLQERGRSDLAYHFLDSYLQQTGDYEGLPLLRFYEVYRALVRAKIAAIRTTQTDLSGSEMEQVVSELRGYVSFARQLCAPKRGAIVITHGVSGSGKSHIAGKLTEFLPAVRLRSDVERKRMLGIDPASDATGRDAYTADITAQTYARLETLAHLVALTGYVAVVDATFLYQTQREAFRRMAGSIGVPFAIMECDAPMDMLRERIMSRSGRVDNVSDAGLGVLESQQASRQPLSDDERRLAVRVGPDRPLDMQALCALLDADCH